MGGCIFATQYSSNGKLQQSVIITLDSIISKTNYDVFVTADDARRVGSQSGLYVFYGFDKIHITGTSVFDNHTGIVIIAQDTSIYLTGNVTFSNNRAVHGPAITQSGNPIIGCVINGTSYDKKDTALFEYYNRFFKFSSNSTLLNISTEPRVVEGTSLQLLYEVYPGQTLYFCFYAHAYGYVHASVNIVIKHYSLRENNDIKVWISTGKSELKENQNCTNTSVTVHTKTLSCVCFSS